jgi:hypothetical protein
VEEAVRWNIKVSRETDLTLRTFLFTWAWRPLEIHRRGRPLARVSSHRQDIKARNADTDRTSTGPYRRRGARGSRERRAKGKA